MSVTVKVEGLREIGAALEQLPEAVTKKVMRQVLTARARPIADAARGNCPVESGELKNSIKVSGRLSRSQAREARESASEVEVYIGPSPLPHAHLVEFGSIHNAPQPYMRPAWDGAKGTLLTNLAADLWAEIKKAAGRANRTLVSRR